MKLRIVILTVASIVLVHAQQKQPNPANQAKEQPKQLALDDVLVTVRSHYPPLLAAWLRQDLANGLIRQAQGAFDPLLTTTLMSSPANYYDGGSWEVLLEQPFTGWGGSVYGGYRLSAGFLPDYDRKSRTSDGGEAVLGLRIPLLRDGTFDSRRAALSRAALDREIANPQILRQYIDFHRAARITYFSWLASGKRLAVANEILRIAKDREKFLSEQAKAGAIAPILEVDNRRLVVSREIAVLQATRRVEATAIELSLFHRNLNTGEPILPELSRLPASFPEMKAIESIQLISDRGRAAFRRPEIREIDLLIARGGIDERLAKNQLKPNLDFAVELNQAIGPDRPKDIDTTEIAGLLRFSVPIGRDEAKGRLQAAQAQLARLDEDKKFARERIVANVNDAFSAVDAAFKALDQARLNVSLSVELESAERTRFEEGASDLLALQIREQATFDAKISEIDSYFAYFKSLADYQAAVGTDAPARLLSGAK